jgi:hypothetical protein
VLDLPKTAQLRFEHVEIEVGRHQQDHADLGLVLDVAGQFQLPKRLDRHPVSHGMGEDVDLLGVAGQQHAAASQVSIQNPYWKEISRDFRSKKSQDGGRVAYIGVKAFDA